MCDRGAQRTPTGAPGDRAPDHELDLSVVIPAHDVEATLPEQLDALATEGWDGRWEVVVVDNRSSDGTAAVVQRRRAQEPWLRLVHADARCSPNYARTVGVEAAESDAIAFCDGDDVIAPGWVAAMREALHDHPVVTGALDVDTLNPPWLVRTRGGGATSLRRFHGTFPICATGNFGIHRDVWRSLGELTDRAAFEDMDISLRIWREGVPVAFEPRAVVQYRYRRTARELWAQGRRYGLGRIALCVTLRDAGLRVPRLSGWRSWLLTALRLWEVVTPTGRARLAWHLGNRAGQLSGFVKYHTVYV